MAIIIIINGANNCLQAI